jgi:hypothetical protein
MENVFGMKCVENRQILRDFHAKKKKQGHNGTASLMIQVENLALKGFHVRLIELERKKNSECTTWT